MKLPATPRGADELNAVFGRIDIYVFDQIMRGRLTPDMRILDAGCGTGRNVHYLLRCGADVFGIDADPNHVARIRTLAADLAPEVPENHFIVGDLRDLPYQNGHFDAVLCSAVLHFAPDEASFESMVAEMWRVLAAGGVFFARLASTIGLENRVTPLGNRRHALPDGTERFLVDEAYLRALGAELDGTLLDPLKTTNVQGLRAMTTWVLRKP